MWIYPFNNLKNVCQNARIKLTNNATIKEANFTPRLTHEKCMKKKVHKELEYDKLAVLHTHMWCFM